MKNTAAKIPNRKLKQSPPNLLKGILNAVFFITLGILLITWLVIDHQLEKLVVKRTSEYAHSIARIAADSSAEALLSDDQLQLNLLVQNVAKDRYIKQATIISEEGQVVAQFPEEITLSAASKSLPGDTDLDENEDVFEPADSSSAVRLEKKIIDQPPKQFLLRQKNKIFIEPLVYQDITAGWFKVEIDKQQLEQNFREAFVEIQAVIGTISLLLFALLVAVVLRFEKNIKQLAVYCQQLLIQNNMTPPAKKTRWLNLLKELSQTHPHQLQGHLGLPKKTERWVTDRMVDNSLFCYLEFKIEKPENTKVADTLSQAEKFLNLATQAFGVQTQGDILSGCLIPILTSNLGAENATETNRENALTEAIGLLFLIRQLLSRITPCVVMKAFIARASLLYLENEQAITTGMALLDESLDKIKHVALNSHYNDIITLSIPSIEIEKLAKIEKFAPLGVEQKNYFRLVEPHSSVQQQIARKFQYLSKA